MSLVPINPLKDILTGSVWDKFKDLIEPYALVNAIIFLILNFLLVLPAAGAAPGSFLGVFTNLTVESGSLDVWSLLVGTILVFVLSYLINHLSTFFLDLCTGELFRDSIWIGEQLVKRQQKRFKEATKAANDDVPGDAGEGDERRLLRDKAAYRLAFEFPRYQSELGLSRLGNILLNPSSYIKHQYGASMHMLWPLLQEKLLDDNKRLKAVQGNWVSLQFFTSLAGLLGLVAIELWMVSRLSFQQVVQVAALLVLAYLCYFISLDKARQWGRGMRRLFDVHLKDVFSELGMEALKSETPASDMFRSKWQDIVGWLAYGAYEDFGYKAQKAWYRAEAVEQWPQIKHPEFLSVKSLPTYKNREVVSPQPDGVYVSYEYLFAITNTSASEHPLTGKGSYLVVQDKGLSLPDQVPGKLTVNDRAETGLTSLDVIGTRQPGDPDALVFQLGEIAPGCSRILTYSLDVQIAAVTSNAEIEKIELKPGALSSEEYIDIHLKKLDREREAQIRIQMLDSSESRLNPYVQVYSNGSALEKMRVDGTVLGDQDGTWTVDLKPDNAKTIRARLGGS